MKKNKEEGYCKGDICNRNGCTGIIDSYEKEGCCSCHINPPCSYCTTPSEYCPKCDWDAEEEQWEAYKAQMEYYKQNPIKPIVYKSDMELYNELKDGEWRYVVVSSGARSVVRIKGKHPNMRIKEIYKKLDISENPCMPRMIKYTPTEFELTYFCD